MLKEIKRIIRNVSEIKVSYCPKIRSADRLKVQSSDDAYKIFLNNWDKGSINWREELWMIPLDQSGGVLGIFRVGAGGFAYVPADPKVLFSVALLTGATSIILAHNHPSGNLKPGVMDQALTTKAKEAGALLDIRVSDHLIITEEGYFSFADEGLM
jgi:DNA repair protein RadC